MRDIDPITLEVIRGSLVSTVLQMRVTLVRTAYAPILYETRDFSCGLMTGGGELLAMSEDIAGHVFAMANGLGAVLEKFKDDIHPGDVLAVNDPYTGGTHLNDIAFYTPFFVDGKLLMFIAVRAHHSDVGGATPGSFSGQDTEIYQEGVRIVPVKIIEKGQINRALWDVLFANMRLPDEREGDVLAMLDTARVAEESIGDLFAKYGPATVQECVKALMDRAEQGMRERIAMLPDGEYYYEHYMDNSGLTPEPLPLKAKLTIEGDTMSFDFTGSAAQVVGPMNCGVPVTRGAAFVVVKSWLDPKSPVNGGTFRPLSFIVPEGSCLAAQLPAPVGGCWDVYRQLQTAVIGLFSQFLPNDLGGENIGSGQHRYMAGFDVQRNRPYILYDYPGGGTPATSDTDGATGCFSYDGGDIPLSQPAESIEQRQPLLIDSLGVTPDLEGAGYRRSGFTINRRVRILSETGQLNVMTDRAVIPPWGSAGAPAGTPNSTTVIRGSKELEPSPIPGKVKGFPLQYGDVVLMLGTSGGGVGDPLEREADLVRTDVKEGYISQRRARDVYGVVFEDGNVDLSKTEGVRRELRSQRPYFRVDPSAEDHFDERDCRLCLIGPDAAARAGVSDGNMVEYVSKATAPLRAWAKVVDGLPQDGVPLGPIGKGILKLAEGDQVWVRPLRIRTVHEPIPA